LSVRSEELEIETMKRLNLFLLCDNKRNKRSSLDNSWIQITGG
jgi:hypothetical protein